MTQVHLTNGHRLYLTAEEAVYVKLALRAVRNWRQHPEYEDIASIAMLGAFEGVGETADRNKLWLERVAWRGAKSALASYCVYQSREKRNPPTIELDPETMVETGLSEDFRDTVNSQLDWDRMFQAACTAEQQQCLRLFYFHGLGYSDIAQVMGVTRKRVDNLLYQGVKRLRAYVNTEA